MGEISTLLGKKMLGFPGLPTPEPHNRISKTGSTAEAKVPGAQIKAQVSLPNQKYVASVLCHHA